MISLKQLGLATWTAISKSIYFRWGRAYGPFPLFTESSAVLVPALAFIAHVPTRKLAGTSSAVVMFTSLAAAVGYLLGTPPSPLPEGFVGFVSVPAAACLVVTAIPGAQLGAWLNRRVGTTVYRHVFGVLLLFVVVRLVTTA
jgi:uncharacterized membrane protein YfcA